MFMKIFWTDSSLCSSCSCCVWTVLPLNSCQFSKLGFHFSKLKNGVLWQFHKNVSHALFKLSLTAFLLEKEIDKYSCAISMFKTQFSIKHDGECVGRQTRDTHNYSFYVQALVLLIFFLFLFLFIFFILFYFLFFNIF